MSLRESIDLLTKIALMEQSTNEDKLVGSLALDTFAKELMTHYNSVLSGKIDKASIVRLTKEEVQQIASEIWEE